MNDSDTDTTRLITLDLIKNTELFKLFIPETLKYHSNIFANSNEVIFTEIHGDSLLFYSLDECKYIDIKDTTKPDMTVIE